MLRNARCPSCGGRNIVRLGPIYYQCLSNVETEETNNLYIQVDHRIKGCGHVGKRDEFTPGKETTFDDFKI